MSAPPKKNQIAAGTKWERVIFWLSIFGLCAVAINSQSLWIDEIYTALKAQQTSLPKWWHELLRAGGSDVQMPLYMLWIWVCEKIFGSGEIALRAVNLFWILPGLIAVWFALARQPQLRLAVFLVAAFNPFLWYYLDEARPYAMQIGASLFLAATICRWSGKNFSPATRESFWVCGFAAALVALSGASMLGMIWAGAAILAAIFLTPKERLFKLARNFILVWLVAVALLAALGFYYLWTLHAGARASNVATTDWKNVAFIGYELLGFAGLGPGRSEIRDGGLQVFKPFALQLGIFAALVLALIFFAIRNAIQNFPRKKFLGLAVIVAVPAVFILAAGFAMHFRVLGRHFAPLLAPVVFLLGFGVSAAWRSVNGKILVLGFFALCFLSGLSLRFATRQAKDDYRDAAALGRAALAHGQTVWWNADANAPTYYQLPLTTNFAEPGKAVLIINQPADFFATNVPAEVVICSRADLYDPHGTLANFLAQKNYHKTAVLPAFVIWENAAGRSH